MNILRNAAKSIYCRIKILFNNNKAGNQYMFVMCKNCKHCIRLPKNKGKFIVTCPNCAETTEVET